MKRQVACFVVLIAWMGSQLQPALSANKQTLSVKNVIDDLLDNGSYDPTIRPLYDDGQAVRVEVDVVLNTLGPLIEREMQMTASFYLRQQWRDPRLSFSPLINDTLLLSQRRVNDLWLPDLYFSQSKNEHRHDITVPNVLIRVYPDGTVLFSQRLTVTYQCLMNLRKFPLDEQTCYIRMESYSHTTEEMYFSWSSKRKSMDILENAHIPDFELKKITTHDCTATYATGTFPCLEARLMLHRQIGFYMIQTYIPCVLIVSLSWLSFWLDTHAIPARISVGLLTVLTITTQSSGIRSELPRVPYTKSIDVWMSVCLVFVFAAYMQYAFVTVFSRRHRKFLVQSPSSASIPLKNDGDESVDSGVSVTTNDGNFPSNYNNNHNHSHNHNHNNNNTSSDNNAPTMENKTPNTTDNPTSKSRPHTRNNSSLAESRSRDMGRVVDKWSRIMFPLCFVLFNFIYWLYYTQAEQSEKID